MRTFTLVLAGCLAVAFGLSEAAPPDDIVVVALRTKARVTEPQVTVGDVAGLRGGSTQVREQIACLDIAYLTHSKDTAVLSREQVAIRLQLAGIPAQSFRLEGPAEVTVRLGSRDDSGDGVIQVVAVETTADVKDEDLAAVAKQQLLQRLPWPPEDVVIRLAEPAHLPPLALTEQDHVRLDAELPPTTTLGARVRVEVTISVNGERRATQPIFFELRLYQAVPVCKRHIESKEMLSTDNLHFDRRAMDPGMNFPSAKECLDRKRARRPLTAGQIVTAGDLESVPADNPVVIHQRDLVKALAKVGNLRIAVTAEALQDGHIGERIRLRNIDSKKELVGRVISSTFVEVEY